MVASRDADLCFARIHTETAMTIIGGVSNAQFGAQFSPTHVQALTVSEDFLVLNEVFHDDEFPSARFSENPWFSSSRWRRLCAVGMMLVPTLLAAQAKPAEDPAKSLKSLQQQIELARRQRLELEAASERVLAGEIADRAKRLAMAGEAGSLQRLEVLLDSSQARLLAQRDRLRTLREATTAVPQAMVVVMLRADVLPMGDFAVLVLIDGTQVKAINYKGDEGRALTSGTAVELYRGAIDPADHKLLVQVAGKGLAAGETVALPAGAQKVNYVEFVLSGGRLLPSAWANKVPAF
jgi:hypothetical protein